MKNDNALTQSRPDRGPIIEDFGQEPLGLAHITTDPSQVAIYYGVGGFLGFVMGGWPIAAYVGFLALNDFVYAKGKNDRIKTEKAAANATELRRILGDEEPATALVGQAMANPAHAIDAYYTPYGTAQPSPVAQLERSLTQEPAIGLPPALMEVVIGHPYSTFIVGMSEAGKDILLFNLAKELKAAYSTAMFVGIDGKNHPGEMALWPDGLYDRKLHISMLDRPQDYHYRLADLLKVACEFPGMVFVNFSELNGIAGSYKAHGLKDEWSEIAHYLRYLALQGNAARKYLLSTAQGLTLDELGITTATRGNIQFLMVGNATQFGFINNVTASTNVFDRKLISNQNTFAAACSRSTALAHLPTAATLKGVAWFHTALSRWESMPRLENPGTDRGAPVTPSPASGQAFQGEPRIPEGVSWGSMATSEDYQPPASGMAFQPSSGPGVSEVDIDGSIELEELIDGALETLYSDPGKQYSLTKLFVNRSQRIRLSEALIDILKDVTGVQYVAKKSGAVVSHYFTYRAVGTVGTD